MEEALNQARTAFACDEVPIGAVIVEERKIIAAAHNQNITLCDPTAHAEILVLRQAALIKNCKQLLNCDIYVTIEPCAMCAFAISLARVRRVYYAAADSKFGSVENGARIFESRACHHRPEVYSGMMEEDAKKLMIDFFKAKRVPATS